MALRKTITVFASATVASTSNGSAVPLNTKGDKFAVQITTGTASGTSPTLDTKLQHSADGTNWIDLISFTQITASDKQETLLQSTATDYLLPLLPYVRANHTIGGTDTPTFLTVEVKILVTE